VPSSVEALGLLTVVLSVLVAATAFYLKRYAPDDDTDAVVRLWRRWRAVGSVDGAAKPKRIVEPLVVADSVEPEPEPEEPETEPEQPEEGSEAEIAVSDRKERRLKEKAEKKAAKQAVKEAKRAEREVAEEVEESEVGAPEPAGAPAEAADDHDHVSLSSEQEQRASGEPRLLLRQRFRRGLQRSRDRLGAEMREAFTGGATPEAFDRIEEALVASDVGVATATAVTESLRDRVGLSDKTLPTAVRDEMVKQLQDADRRLRLVRGRVSVWVVCGVNGTGKTTTIAKLAARAKDLGISVSLAAADTFRAAAVEQISEWGRRLDVDVVKQDQGADPGAVVFDALAHAKANNKRLLIVDTAGRLHTRKPLMDELQKVIRVIEREEGALIAETLLVIDATTGQNGISQAKAFKDAANVTGLALAKLDGTAKGGIVFAVEKELGIPVKAVGVGESEKDLVPFEPGAFVDALIGTDED
jgi:fused signal recognition particle receptor